MDKRFCRQNNKTNCCPQHCATKRGPADPPGLTPDYNATSDRTVTAFSAPSAMLTVMLIAI